MAWLTSFLLGRPCHEYSFEVNPGVCQIRERSLAAYNTILNGDLKKGVLKTSMPTIQIASNYLTKTQRDQFASLVNVSETFLSFKTRDDWKALAIYAVPTDTTHITLPNTSATRLSAALVAAGCSSQITITYIAATPIVPVGFGSTPFGDGPFGDEGFNLTGMTYDDATRVITLTTPLPNTNPVYIDYTYSGWLVNMREMGHRAQAGWVDLWAYDFTLEGV